MKKTFLFILLALSLSAKVLISPIDAMKANYSQDAKISKKNIMLSNIEFKKVQQQARAKLNTKIYRVYLAKKDNKIVGYGILINRKVRSKNAVVLYFISKRILQNIEIIAFNEPREYIPTKKWQSQFQNIPTNKMLKLSREIPTITGATLSARSVTDASRVAFAIYNEVIRKK
jgi:Na+-translocating ferredoxin:NAD+ oxidoreductase RnfG subunit